MNTRREQTERDRLTGKIMQCAIEVHRGLGPGLLESAYEECLTLSPVIARRRYVSTLFRSG